MGTQDYTEQYEIYDYSTYTLTEIRLEGEFQYFENVINGQVRPVPVRGDGTSRVDELPFVERLEISTAANVDLEDLRISGNKVKIYNSGSSNITVQTGITGSLTYTDVRPKTILKLYFDGSNWLIENTNQAYGINSCKLYDDSGVLKMTTGYINLDNGSGNELVYFDSVETISFAGITNSRWFTVELTRSGVTPTLTAVELSTDTNPYALPASIDSYYEPEKGGYYRVGTGRIVGFGWKATGGTLAGIVNAESIIEGYAGYSTGEVIGHIYRWDKRLEDTKDDNYIGLPYIIPTEDRPATPIISGGSDVTWADVDSSAYVPYGARCIIFWIRAYLIGDGVDDLCKVHMRKKGSTATDVDKTVTAETEYDNLVAGKTIRSAGHFFVLCNDDAESQYYVEDSNGQGRAYISPVGYFI